MYVKCDTPLESSQRELQVFFRPHPNRRFEQKIINSQSGGSPNRDSFGTPPWESWDKKPFGCRCHGEMQRILYGGRWWLPFSPSRGEFCDSKVARGLFKHQGAPECGLTHCDAPPSSLLDPKRVQLCERTEVVGTWCRSQLPTLKGVRGAY
jgi:hypothetical protein